MSTTTQELASEIAGGLVTQTLARPTPVLESAAKTMTDEDFARLTTKIVDNFVRIARWEIGHGADVAAACETAFVEISDFHWIAGALATEMLPLILTLLGAGVTA